MGREEYMGTDCKHSVQAKEFELDLESCGEPFEVSMQESDMMRTVGVLFCLFHRFS